MALEEFEAYRLMSELDSNVIELADWNVANGAVLRVGKSTANENQMWVAQMEDEGYQFRGRIQHGREIKVVTADDTDKVTHTIYETSYTQEWILEPVVGAEGIFHVKNRASGKYLTNAGVGEQVVVTADKTADKNQLWRFVHVP